MELAVGTIISGKVTAITKFGAFVSLPGGKSGLVHISEVAAAFVSDVHDYLTEGQEVTVLTGGDGGKGNARFSNSRRHAPHFSQTGEKTEKKRVLLELKTIADVGLIGFPNVGKSTLLSKVTKARPKIANYHFTTLSPNLGVVNYYDDSFVLADIPGLIEGAAEGAGLGHDFLRHIERTRMLIHVVDVSGMEGRDPYEDYRKINAELAEYSEVLSRLPQIVALNKCDVFGAEENAKAFTEKLKGAAPVFSIEAVSGAGTKALLDATVKLLKELPPPAPLEYEPFVYEKPERLTYEILENDDGSFEIVGTLVDVLSRNVVISDMHSFAYMQKVLKDRGIFKELRAKGAKNGTAIVIGGIEFEFMD